MKAPAFTKRGSIPIGAGHQWAAASEGIPWVSVYQSDAGDRTHISQYAVGQFPTYFVIRNGSVVGRTSDSSELPNLLKK